MSLRVATQRAMRDGQLDRSNAGNMGTNDELSTNGPESL